MPRARYTITAEDYNFALHYLRDRLRSGDLELRDDGAMLEARERFAAVDRLRGAGKRADALNGWAEEHLPSAEWEKLKNAIRKRRERWNRGGERKSVVISATAHRMLSRVAKRDGITLSEVIVRHVGKELGHGGKTSRRSR